MRTRALLAVIILGVIVTLIVLVTGDRNDLRGALGGTGTYRERVRRFCDTNADGTLTSAEMIGGLRRMLVAVSTRSRDTQYDMDGDMTVNKVDRFRFVLTLREILKARCGDGEIDPPNEQCDDRNTLNGDGCSSVCIKEPRHLACVQYQCIPVVGTGANTCTSNLSCAPTYDITVSINVQNPTFPISADHVTRYTVDLTATTERRNMLAILRIPYLGFETPVQEIDSRCTVTGDLAYCHIDQISPSAPVSFAFALQPPFEGNCLNRGNFMHVLATITEDRAHTSTDPPSYPRTLTVPYACTTQAVIKNNRVTPGTSIHSNVCSTTSNIGNGYNDFLRTMAWVKDAVSGKIHIFASLTGAAAQRLVFDPITGELTDHFYEPNPQGFSIIFDAVMDPQTNKVYAVRMTTSSTTIDTYNLETGVIENAQFINIGSASSPFRRAVIRDGKAYFFLRGYATQTIYVILSLDLATQEIKSTVYQSIYEGEARQLASRYPATSVDTINDARWQSCFIWSPRIPLQ